MQQYPTKAICPILLEDMRKISVEREGHSHFFTSEDIKNCMKKVIPLNLHQTVRLDNELEIRPYYAGHVLGAAMFYVKDLVTGKSVVYTGDYNMTPDRHLGAATIDRLYPDLFITETTYATTIRDPKSSRERDFLKAVHKAVERGGKVLIPVFALGRVQELLILIETYWERMNLKVPIYFSAGIVQKANHYYQLFINWTNQKIKNTFVRRNMFDFAHVQSFDRSMIDNPGPMVVFATPGMLHAGMSLEIFKRWAPNEKNLIIVPGYCVEGTVGNKLLTTKNGKVEVDSRGTIIDVRCEVRQISFSAHADAKGILHLIRQVQPKAIMLVHGEKGKMNFFKQKIERDMKIPCFDPANGTTVDIPTEPMSVEVDVSLDLLKSAITKHQQTELSDIALAESQIMDSTTMDIDSPVSDTIIDDAELAKKNTPSLEDRTHRFKRAAIEGILIMDNNNRDNTGGGIPRPSAVPRFLAPHEAAAELGLRQHKLKFSSVRNIPAGTRYTPESTTEMLYNALVKYLPDENIERPQRYTIQFRSIGIFQQQQQPSSQPLHTDTTESHQTRSKLVISWSLEDDNMAERVLSIVDEIINTQLLNIKSH